jgi:hypothetical protein
MMVYRGAIVSLHEETMINYGIPVWGSLKRYHQDQVGCMQGKGIALQGFPFTGLKLVVGRTGYMIDSRTIKRGFWLSNLIASS